MPLAVDDDDGEDGGSGGWTEESADGRVDAVRGDDEVGGRVLGGGVGKL